MGHLTNFGYFPQFKVFMSVFNPSTLWFLLEFSSLGHRSGKKQTNYFCGFIQKHFKPAIFPIKVKLHWMNCFKHHQMQFSRKKAANFLRHKIKPPDGLFLEGWVPLFSFDFSAYPGQFHLERSLGDQNLSQRSS
jgi:hypothetical protein